MVAECEDGGTVYTPARCSPGCGGVSMVPERLIEPMENRVDGAITLPFQSSATLSLDAMRSLRTCGIAYLIPSMPHGYPPVKAEAAVISAASHFPVGSNPRVHEMAIIAIAGEAVPPLRHGLMCWVIRFTIDDCLGHSHDFFAFVNVRSGEPLGGLDLP